jgi:peptidoglycan/xylan/chitin deacetylase (PgdA/CDA1 family)
VLAVLRALDVPATFFMVGQEMVLRPGLVRRVLREGHQVGSEGWSHPDMRGLSAAQVNAQLRRTAAVYREITGGGAMSLWRPPYGAESSSVIAAGAGEGLALVLWTVDPKDYARSGLDWVGEVLRIVDGSQGVEDGGVLLLHSGVTATVEALPTIVRAYWSRGLCFGVLRAGGEWRWPVESPGLRYRVSAVEPEGEVG